MYLRSCVFLFLAVVTVEPALAQKRIALLIGNQDYAREVGPLKNPINDVNLIAASLRKIGFAKDDIRIIINGKRREILRAIDRHAKALRAEGPDAIGFLYYSGHGAANKQDKRNYLIPVEVKRLNADVWYDAIPLDGIVSTLSTLAQSASHFVIFDACRNLLNMPIRGGKGFVPVSSRRGMFIAFSTDPGETASDDGHAGGPYATALSTELLRPGLHHLDLFQNVKERVLALTGGQVPWERNGLVRRVYLSNATTSAATASPSTFKPSRPAPLETPGSSATPNCRTSDPTSEFQSCVAKLIAGGDQFKIDDLIRTAIVSTSQRVRGVALRAYISTRKELDLKFIPPSSEMKKLKSYIASPTRENKHQMLRERRYLIFLNESDFSHAFKITEFDFRTGRGQLREIGRGSDTPHVFNLTGTRLSFDTPWCLKKLLNCRCRYEMKLSEAARIEGTTVCTGYFGFKPLKVFHEMNLN